MNRRDFQVLANLRVIEAKALLDNEHFPGAYYLVGYAVECALKACIAKRTNRFDFPPKPNEVRNIYSHNIESLLEASGLKVEHESEARSNPQFALNWTTTKDWNEESRYSATISKAEAEDLYSAVSARRNGVLSWVKKWW